MFCTNNNQTKPINRTDKKQRKGHISALPLLYLENINFKPA